jgi:succinate dehydrogenase flavin-adding protein (antitoxin of CptAB toxin-antitoxin module)
MRIKILTKEESDALVESFYKDRLEWTTELLVADAKHMMSLPDMGNTKYILSNQYEDFYKWLETEEARQEWNKSPYMTSLAKYYSEIKK